LRESVKPKAKGWVRSARLDALWRPDHFRLPFAPRTSRRPCRFQCRLKNRSIEFLPMEAPAYSRRTIHRWAHWEFRALPLTPSRPTQKR
jgi:hypothetical protein